MLCLSHIFEAMFVSGAMNNDYGFMFNGKMTKTDNYTATGISNAVLGSRLSYVFNLTGPCMVLDTACSASLVAIHQGCLAILSGELLVVGLSLLYTRAAWPPTAVTDVHQGPLAIYRLELVEVGLLLIPVTQE